MVGCGERAHWQQAMIHASPVPSASATPSSRPMDMSGTTQGVIAGAVIGGILILVIILTLLIMFLCRRRKKKQNRQQAQDYYDAIHPRGFALMSPSPGPAFSERNPFESTRSSMIKPVWGQDLPAPAPPPRNHPLNNPWPLSPYEGEPISPGTVPVVEAPADMHAKGKRRENVYEMRTSRG